VIAPRIDGDVDALATSPRQDGGQLIAVTVSAEQVGTSARWYPDAVGPMVVTDEWTGSESLLTAEEVAAADPRLMQFCNDLRPLVVWNTTRRCNLACLHCRAAAGSGPYPGELTTAAGIKLLDDLATMGQVVVILTGGEPLLRHGIEQLIEKLARLQKASIAYGLEHRKEALAHAMQYARGLSKDTVDRFVGMYVNKRTLDYGEDGKQAVKKILDLAYRKKIIPNPVNVEFIG